jgi:hypothetical protein
MKTSSKYALLYLVASFVTILVLIAAVRFVFPGVLYDGFADLSCYGVVCAEGQFCQNKKCIDINPKYTNNYFSEGFQVAACPPGTAMKDNACAPK